MKTNKRDTKFAYAINAPLIIYLVCILVGPVLWGIYMSFTNKIIGGDATFIGIKNYVDCFQMQSIVGLF